VSRFRRPAAAIALTVSLAGVTVAASACSLASPKVIATPYAAADGTNADLTVPGSGTIQFRNFLVVSQAKGSPGVLIGAVTTDSVQPLQVQLAVLDPSGQSAIGQANLTVEPGQLTRFGPGGTDQLQVPDVQVPPGAVLTVSVRSVSGTKSFTVPVLGQQSPYDTVTPSPVASTSATSESPTPTGSASPGASATVKPSPRSTASPSAKVSASPTK